MQLLIMCISVEDNMYRWINRCVLLITSFFLLSPITSRALGHPAPPFVPSCPKTGRGSESCTHQSN